MLAKLCSMDERFREEYDVVILPKYFAIHYPESRELAENHIQAYSFWKSIGLFIFHEITEEHESDNRFHTSSVIKKLRGDCQKISVTFLDFYGYFPQVISENRQFNGNYAQTLSTKYKDKYVLKLLGAGLSTEEVIEAISDEDFLSEDYVCDFMKNEIEELRIREMDVDIGMCDYIEKYGYERQLFYVASHPSGEVLGEMANRIIGRACNGHQARLNERFSETDYYVQCGSLKGQDVPLYPAVIRKLGLKKYEKYSWINRYSGFEQLLSFKDYMRVYIEHARSLLESIT